MCGIFKTIKNAVNVCEDVYLMQMLSSL